MVHGFRGDHHGMDLIAGSITDREVIVPDLPGFGLTDPLDSGSSLSAFVDHLVALRAEIGRQRGVTPILVGHSFGSILVSHLAASHRDTIDELVTALDAYRGALLVVSHDDAFLTRLRIDTWIRLDPGGLRRGRPAAAGHTHDTMG